MFTWYLPNKERPVDPYEWEWYGGKWVIHDSLRKSREVATRLEPFLEDGPIESAKIWHGDPTALIVYSFDSHKKPVYEILNDVGAGNARVWVYDSILPNFMNPIHFSKAVCLMINTISKGTGKYRPL